MSIGTKEKDMINGMCPGARNASLGSLISGGMSIYGNPIGDGGEPTEGTWRQNVNSSTGDLEIQCYQSGAWSTKQTIEIA